MSAPILGLRNDQHAEPGATADVVNVVGRCMVTKKIHIVRNVPKDGLRRFADGAFIQDALPGLSDDEREFLISGYSPEGWAQVFDGEDE